VRPYYYPRPYYAFRPRVSVGFGLWVGFPVAYPAYGYITTTYGYPGYPYPSPYVSYPPYGHGSVAVAPGPGAYGGVSFEIGPADASVYVDGAYIGPVTAFTPSTQPLTLAPGPHRIEVQAPGYQPIVFDVTIVPGEVIPYRGALVPVP
jgi:hypothetical protein